MNPAAGSFAIDPRLQRHFAVLSVSYPKREQLLAIYDPIVRGHMQHVSFPSAVMRIVDQMIKSVVDFHLKISEVFTATAVKFFYCFSMRDLTQLVLGLLMARPTVISSELQFVTLFLHECQRVYGDRITLCVVQVYLLLIYKQRR